MRKLGLCLVVVVRLVSGLIGCGNDTKGEQQVLKIGINGEVNSIWKSIQNRLADQGVTLEFIELVAQQIPRSFDDVTLAVMNNNVAIQSGISVIDESIFIESQETEGIEQFFNMIAVQEGHKKDPLIQIFLEVYQTEETKEAMYNEFNGGWIPLF